MCQRYRLALPVVRPGAVGMSTRDVCRAFGSARRDVRPCPYVAAGVITDAMAEVVLMAKAQVSTKDRLSAARRHTEAPTPVLVPAEKNGKQHLSPFWRHFLQMLAAMVVGMLATGAIFLATVGAKTWDEVTIQYPTQALLAMAAGMTVPMVAWMTYRGMGWKNSYEMAAVMIVPVIPLLCLVWFDVTNSAPCGQYCLLSIAAMLGLMLYRRDAYSVKMARR